MKIVLLGSIVVSTVLMMGCNSSSKDEIKDNTQKINTSGSLLPYTVLDNTIDNGLKIGTKMEIRNGGFGSAAFKDPHNINRFFCNYRSWTKCRVYR